MKRITPSLWLLLALFIVTLVLAACAPAFDRRVIVDAPTYRIIQTGDTTYAIYSMSGATNRKVADGELACKSRPCFMSPGGVILLVERPILPEN